MLKLGGSRVRIADIVAATAVVAYAGVLRVGVGSGLTTTAVSDLVQIAAPAFAGFTSLRASLGCTDRAVRRGWAFLTASCWAWAAGQAVWTWLEVVARTEPFPSLADLGYLGAVPLGLVAIHCFSMASPRPGLRMRSSVEGMIIAGSLLFISWAFVLGPSWRMGEGDLFPLLLSLAYPFGNIVTAT
ncbi:MAG: hypothetical protein H0U26_09945, partial [Acidimicrobiia bacterium]|nr:hypothetical protein [Acidimicrobiia bacterium]